MLVTRKGFLGLLASAGILAAEAKTTVPFKKGPIIRPTKPTPKKAPVSAPAPTKGQLLIDSYLPILKVNEGESLTFYHKTGDKVTVGYGTNVESNQGYLSDVSIYFKGKALTQEQRKTFFKEMAAKTQDDLAQYSITAADAKKMAVKGMREAITSLEKTFATAKKADFFHSLPLCMQALCLDVFYNVGKDGFKKFSKFQAAIRGQNYDEAVKQSVVYTNTAKRTTNIKREWMKKRLLSVMRIVQANPKITPSALTQLITRDYEQKTPLMMRLLQRSNLAGELSMAKGELTHLQQQSKQKAKTPATKPAPSFKDLAVLRAGTTRRG